MGRNRKLSPEDEAEVRARSISGEPHTVIALDYDIHPSTITYIMRRDMKRITRYNTMEIAARASEKLLKAVENSGTDADNDRKFLTEAFKASADRSGLSPQAVSLQISQSVGVAVKVQPLLAATEGEDLKRLLTGGNEE